MNWEEKIDCLVTLAKAVGRYTNADPAEPGEDNYHRDARRKLLEAYDAFCEWRHDEPYVVVEIKALLEQKGEYIDEVTGVLLTVERNVPDHPRITVTCPSSPLSIEQINGAISRLRVGAEISSTLLPDLQYQRRHTPIEREPAQALTIIRDDLLAWAGYHRGKGLSEDALPRFHEIIDQFSAPIEQGICVRGDNEANI